MKRNTNSIILCFLLIALMSFQYVCAFANSPEKQNDNYALDICKEIGIFEGDNGNLRPNSYITRAEAITVVLRMVKLDDFAKSVKGKTAFSDVDEKHWATGYINAGFIKGIVSGNLNGMFLPNSNITEFEMIKMIVCTLGYSGAVERLGGLYPQDYLNFAKEHNIIEKISDKDRVITRREAAELIYNALFTEYINADGNREEPLANMYGIKEKINPLREKNRTYYLSPQGDDNADGSETSPWKTVSVATMRLKPGDTLVLEDGEYIENEIITFSTGGEEDAPIIITARNKHAAKIIFTEKLKDARKFFVDYGQDYITIQNLEITQEGISASKTNDILVCIYGNYCAVLNNKIHHAFEETVKSHKTTGLRVENNILYDTVHDIIDFVNVENAIVKGNVLREGGRAILLAKGGSRNVQIYNNLIQNDTKTATGAIEIGGSTDNYSGLGSSKEDYEGYSLSVYNNIIYCSKPGLIERGITICGSVDNYVYNNVVYGCQTGVTFNSPAGIAKGWEWNPVTKNSYLYNNIFVECTKTAYNYMSVPYNMSSDYNVFYKTNMAPVEENSMYVDPGFIKAGEDFRLSEKSHLIGKGREIDSQHKGYNDSVIYLDFRDFAGNVRDEWSPGAYVFGALTKEKSETVNYADSLFAETFDYSGRDYWSVASGEWQVANGVHQQMLDDTGGKIMYTDGTDWTDYTYEADVEVLKAEARKEWCSGIFFRGDTTCTNTYAFRFNTNSMLEVCKWDNGVFYSIDKWEFESEPGSIYRMKVEAKGNHFTFYVNDEKVNEIVDDTHKRGSVGLYTFYLPARFDNLLVREIK